MAKSSVYTILEYQTRKLEQDNYVKSLTLQLDAENEYTFAGNVYEVIHVTKGGFDTHHWAEFQLACSSVYHYDNLKRNGVAVPLEDFVSDDKIEYVVLRRK